MRGPEGVVDVAVDPLDEPGGESRVVAFLPGVETEVLQQLDAGRQLGQPCPHRVHRVLRVWLPLRAAQMAGCDDLRAALLQPLQRRQSGADTEVVGDPRRVAVERHVEVGADEDPLPVERSQLLLEILERRDLAHRRRRERLLTFFPAYSTKSTIRLE